MADDPHDWDLQTDFCRRCGCARIDWQDSIAKSCVRVTAVNDFTYIARRMREIAEERKDGC